MWKGFYETVCSLKNVALQMVAIFGVRLKLPQIAVVDNDAVISRSWAHFEQRFDEPLSAQPANSARSRPAGSRASQWQRAMQLLVFKSSWLRGHAVGAYEPLDGRFTVRTRFVYVQVNSWKFERLLCETFNTVEQKRSWFWMKS